MKVSKEQVAQNRDNILAAARRLFAHNGFEAVSVAEVMKEAGLTHGAFYGHFASKDDLVVQTCAYAVKPAEGKPNRTLADYAAGYLSAHHRDNRGQGCPYAALGSEVARHPAPARHELTQGLRRLIDRLGETAPGEDEAARRANTISSLSTMLGGLVLARMVDDEAFSDELLAVNRAALAQG